MTIQEELEFVSSQVAKNTSSSQHDWHCTVGPDTPCNCRVKTSAKESVKKNWISRGLWED